MWLLVLVIYTVMSVLSCMLMAYDKRASVRSPRSRVRESTLHWVELLGGWPGALMAQWVFRHKTHKRSYRIMLWMIVVLHLLGWAAWLIWLR
jgi:uncharacterized membrane protein YsdA (DUF1294 family)